MSQKQALKNEYQNLLLLQKNSIEDYLHLLQQAKEAIVNSDQEKIEYYTSLELAYTDKIVSSHKTMHNFAQLNKIYNDEPYLEVFENKNTVLLEKALDINRQNRQLLKERMHTLKIKMAEVQKKIKAKGGYVSQSNEDPRFIDISS